MSYTAVMLHTQKGQLCRDLAERPSEVQICLYWESQPFKPLGRQAVI